MFLRNAVRGRALKGVVTPRLSNNPYTTDTKTSSFEDWDDESKFLNHIANSLQIKEMSDWYKITKQDFFKYGGYKLLRNKFNSSPSLFVQKMFPTYSWLPWKFSVCPRNFWDSVENQKKFINWVENELKIKEKSDWYNITVKDFYNVGGSSLLSNKYNTSMFSLLSTLYPDFDWIPWKFSMVPKNFWDEEKNQRKFLEWSREKLGIKEMSDWYNVTQKLGGTGLLNKYNGSPPLLLSKVYPNYEWLPWKFKHIPSKYWKDNKNKIKFIDWVGKQLGIKEESEWYKVTPKQVSDLGGSTLLSDYMTLPQLLSLAYPHYNWGVFQIKSKESLYKKSQSLLKTMLKTIFPNDDVLEEYRHPDILTSSGHPLELDFFYPNLNLAFEYQGQQHYRSVKMFHNASSVEEDKLRDLQKGVLCKAKGITLVEVPYWWDRKFNSLAASVFQQRPDLFKEAPMGTPIPLSPPSEEQRARTRTKNSLMTATVWNDEKEPKGWWMTEKFDGVRLYWNGSNFMTRQGKKLEVPESITKQLPSEALDGELWTQYGLFQDAVSLCRKVDEDKWKKAIFWVFDAPGIPNRPFEDRIDYLREMKERGSLPSFVRIVETVKCEGKEHLKEYFDKVIAKGGEGVMLREPKSLYKGGRSTSLAKFKPFFDTEVKVLENNYPHGFNCLQINGKSLFVGFSDNSEDARKIKAGAVITVKHFGTNVYGVLQHPKFYRERTDVTWNEIINT